MFTALIICTFFSRFLLILYPTRLFQLLPEIVPRISGCVPSYFFIFGNLGTFSQAFGQIVVWFKLGLTEIVRVVFVAVWPILFDVSRCGADI